MRVRKNHFRTHKNLLPPWSFKRFLECIATFALVFNLRGCGGLLWWGTRKYILHHWGAHCSCSVPFKVIYPLLRAFKWYPSLLPTDRNLASITHFHRKKINTVSVCHSESSAFYFDLFYVACTCTLFSIRSLLKWISLFFQHLKKC